MMRETEVAAVRGPVLSAAPMRSAGVLAILLGVFLLYGVGFAQIPAVHDVAHDGRHSFAFPCH